MYTTWMYICKLCSVNVVKPIANQRPTGGDNFWIYPL